MPSSEWLTSKARERGQAQALEEGRRAFRRGEACPSERWRRLGWEDAATRTLRRERIATC